MDYVGEHLLPGKLGQFFVVLSFAASFVATLSYFKSANAKNLEDQSAWKKMARFAFDLPTAQKRCLRGLNEARVPQFQAPFFD